MSSYFVDSSALAKLYHQEAGTYAMDGIINAEGARICISRLTLVEIPSVFAIKVRTQFISREDAAAALHRFREDILERRFAVFSIQEPEFALAELLIEKYAFDFRLRALDAVQVAVALRLRTQSLIDHLVAADKVLCEVAAREGFSVLNPEASSSRQ